MSNNEGFGSWESICLLINMIFVQGILHFPKDAAGMVGSAGWIIPIAITIIAYIYFAIATGFYRQHGNLDLLEISEKSVGRIFKIIVGLLAALLLVFLEVSLLGEYAHSLKIVSLDKSPLAYILIFFSFGDDCGSILWNRNCGTYKCLYSTHMHSRIYFNNNRSYPGI